METIFALEFRQFYKLEVDEPTDYYFSLTLSSRISGRA